MLVKNPKEKNKQGSFRKPQKIIPGKPKQSCRGLNIELHVYIRTRGRTGDAACTNATGRPQGDTGAILTKWPHKHTLWDAVLSTYKMAAQTHAVRCCFGNLENGRLRACRGCVSRPVRPLVLLYNSMAWIEIHLVCLLPPSVSKSPFVTCQVTDRG